MNQKKKATNVNKKLEAAKKAQIKNISRDGALEDFDELLKRAAKPTKED